MRPSHPGPEPPSARHARDAGVVKQFQNSFLHVIPGTDAAWVILGILEFAVFVVLLASLPRGEFLPHREKSLTQVAPAIALITFACLACGQTATGQFEGTASLYQYFGATAVILILVSLLPPNRPDRWLRMRGEQHPSRSLRSGHMAETIWSVIAVVGGLGMVVVILYFLVTGHHDRDREEEARRFFDEHGHWPDESPS